MLTVVEQNIVHGVELALEIALKLSSQLERNMLAEHMDEEIRHALNLLKLLDETEG